MPKRQKTEFFSVFNECTAAAAQMIVDAGKGTKIELDQIPESARFDEHGRVARFAVAVFGPNVPEFHRLCREMYL
jgi:hypothetical protein